MNWLLGALKAFRKDQVLLTETKFIDEGDLSNPAWETVKEGYEKTTDPTDKIVVTIVNSILYQERGGFCLTRDKVKAMYKADSNWKETAFTDDHWSIVLAKLHRIVKTVQEGYGRKPAVYEVTHPSLLAALKCNVEEQVKRSLEFANKKNSPSQPMKPFTEPKPTTGFRPRNTKYEV